MFIKQRSIGRANFFPPMRSWDRPSQLKWGDFINSLETSSAIDLYIHIPFCHHRCPFCCLNTFVTQDKDIIRQYFRRLEEDLDFFYKHLGKKTLTSIVIGGGTPSLISPGLFGPLLEKIENYFQKDEDFFGRIEIHPKHYDYQLIKLLAQFGFRSSVVGVQDLSSPVLNRSRRHYELDHIKRLWSELIALGYTDKVLELIYGLPDQKAENFIWSLKQLKDFQPEAYALYPFMPTGKIEVDEDFNKAPNQEDLEEISRNAFDYLQSTNYQYLCFGHLYRSDSWYSQFRENQQLQKSLRGIIPYHHENCLALGVSGISQSRSYYAQSGPFIQQYLKARPALNKNYYRSHKRSTEETMKSALTQRFLMRHRLDKGDIPDISKDFGPFHPGQLSEGKLEKDLIEIINT